MWTQLEKERIDELEREISSLRSDLTLHQIMISGLIHTLLCGDSEQRESFFSVLRKELNKFPNGSISKQELEFNIQKWIDAQR